MTGGYDVVVLAGGRSTRYGSDKLAVLLDTVLAGLPADAAVVCVGAKRATRRQGVRWVREEPAYGGPLAAVGAGVRATSGDVVVLVGGDMPSVGAAVTALVDAVLTGGRPSVLLDGDGTAQPLASAWPRDLLVGMLDAAAPLDGRPVRLLLGAAPDGVQGVPDSWGAARDVDVPGELGD